MHLDQVNIYSLVFKRIQISRNVSLILLAVAIRIKEDANYNESEAKCLTFLFRSWKDEDFLRKFRLLLVVLLLVGCQSQEENIEQNYY